MDELIAARIIDSDISTRNKEFVDIVNVINKMSLDEYLKVWIRSQNNFIGFCVGAKSSIDYLLGIDLVQLRSGIKSFESAFASVDVSKVNLGKVRRESVSRYVKDIDSLAGLDEFDLQDKISDWI